MDDREVKRARKDDAPLEHKDIDAVVKRIVMETSAVDIHTHLFPVEHGQNFHLWGIDELLTYHYLVSEMFMVAPGHISHDYFFSLPKTKQADLVWKLLFVERSPLSEAQIGVLTVLSKLGLGEMLRRKDLDGIRRWFSEQDPSHHTDRVFELAGLRCVVMTNIPFDACEADKWVKNDAIIDFDRNEFAESDKTVARQGYCTSRFKTALRIDPFLKGDWGTICECLRIRGLPLSRQGAMSFLEAWAKVYSAEYLLASTPHDFHYGDNDVTREPGWPSASQLIDDVVIPVAAKLRLPIAIKLGAKRGMSAALSPCGGGDGVVMADILALEQLCRRFPHVKFLATCLSRVDQHQLCVLTQKFKNLHVYGCWWYCNNPSIVDEVTRMRLEMLGTAFTAQHSDSRVLDQLIYKWDHSRRVIADALADQYKKLCGRGWPVTEADVNKDVWRLLGGSYEEFKEKELGDVDSLAVPAPPLPIPMFLSKARLCKPGVLGCGCC